MNSRDVLEYLNNINPNIIRFGLENTLTILENPALTDKLKPIPFIQVAGTNGKGSTSHFIASILQAAGCKVGLFTSPHLNNIRERIAINKKWIPGDDFVSYTQTIKELSEKLLAQNSIEHIPTYFEYTFLVALLYFSAQNVDIAVLEVGLGGRLDATTAVTPIISVITGISHDHTQYLGHRIKDIAAEKAGIIKKNIPIICGCSVHSIAHHVIKKTALLHHAPFFNVIDSQNHLEITPLPSHYQCRYATPLRSYSFDLHMNGQHQPFNAATALKTIEVLSQQLPSFYIPIDAIREGTAINHIPARIEILPQNPTVILDGAHNAESTSALANFLKEKNKKKLTLIFGVLADKDYKKMISILLPFIENVILTEPLSPRALPLSDLSKIFKRKGKKTVIKPGIEEAYNAARELNREILATGSFYLVGALRELVLREKPAPPTTDHN